MPSIMSPVPPRAPRLCSCDKSSFLCQVRVKPYYTRPAQPDHARGHRLPSVFPIGVLGSVPQGK